MIFATIQDVYMIICKVFSIPKLINKSIMSSIINLCKNEIHLENIIYK